MKKFIFAFLIVLFSAALAGIAFGQRVVNQVQDVVGEQIFPKDGMYSSIDGRLAEGTGGDSGVLVNRLQDGDVIFFLSGSELPNLKANEKTNTINLGEGIYLISAFDAYREYEVHNTNFKIQHLSNGIYFVDTRGGEVRIFSMTALLQLEFIASSAGINDAEHPTQVEIFPSEYISYSPSITEKITHADVFRIGQLTDFGIVDSFKETGFSQIFGTNAEDSKILLDEYLKYYKARQGEIQKTIAKFSPKTSKGYGKLEDFGMLFVNDQKKRILLENSLVELLQTMILIDSGKCNFCKNEGLTQEIITTKIGERLESLRSIDEPTYENAKNLVRKYLTFGSSVTALHSAEYYGKGGSILTAVYQSIFGTSNGAKSGKVYKLLTDVYSQYFFGEKNQADLQKNLASYVTFLVDSGLMGDREFLGFTYFLKEFLNSGGNADDSNIKLFSQMISIAGKYIESLQEDREKSGMLSTFYFTFSSISKRLEQGILDRFFEGTPDNLVLKSEYRIGDEENVSEETIASLDFLIKKETIFLSKYRSLYKASIGETTDDTVDYFTQFSESTRKLSDILQIFKNYDDYRTERALSDASKGASGLTIESKALTKESITEYLSDFVGVDISTLELTNDFESDKFYQISVNIFGRPFKFRINPKGNWIESIIFIDADGTENHNFEQMSISLDARKKKLSEDSSRANTQEEREKYNIRNFFKSTFFATSATPADVGPTNPQDNEPPISPQMQLFIQRELIEKDFTLTANFFPISMRNIRASIINGDYNIILSDIKTTASAKDMYALKFDSKYIFQNDLHAFKDLGCTVDTLEKKVLYDGKRIEIIPTQIDTVDFEAKYKKIGPLLDILSLHYAPGSGEIQLDLGTNSVIIGGVTYTE